MLPTLVQKYSTSIYQFYGAVINCEMCCAILCKMVCPSKYCTDMLMFEILYLGLGLGVFLNYLISSTKIHLLKIN